MGRRFSCSRRQTLTKERDGFVVIFARKRFIGIVQLRFTGGLPQADSRERQQRDCRHDNIERTQRRFLHYSLWI